MASIKLRLSGPALIMHNGQTADPRNRFSKALKEISGKRKKTDADLNELARIEFLAGLYFQNNDIVIPDYVLESSFIAGAKKTKSGPQAKAGMFVEGSPSLEFEGKPAVITEDVLSKLFEEGNHSLTVGVKVGQSKVMRTRPLLRNWSAVVEVQYEDDLVSRASVIEFAKDAGRQVGIGDWRPKYGRFTVEVVG